MVDFAVVVVLVIVVVDVVVVVVIGGVEGGFDVFVSCSVSITVVGCAFSLASIVVDIQLLLPLFLL